MISNAEWRATGIRLLELAIALRRNPTYAAGITPVSELPQGMEFLLRVANGDAEQLAWSIQNTHASEDEIKQAAIGFIEKIAFWPGADNYRVLCLNPWATPVDIKEHYRLLIRLFHPDRGLAHHASADEYSSRINQAYAATGKGANLSAGSVNAGASVDIPARPFIHLRQHRTSMDSAPRMDSLLAGLTPQYVLKIMAGAAFLIVGWIYLENREPAPVAMTTAVLPERTTANTSPSVMREAEGESKLNQLLVKMAPASTSMPPAPAAAVPATPQPQRVNLPGNAENHTEQKTVEPVPPLPPSVRLAAKAPVLAESAKKVAAIPQPLGVIPPVKAENNIEQKTAAPAPRLPPPVRLAVVAPALAGSDEKVNSATPVMKPVASVPLPTQIATNDPVVADATATPAAATPVSLPDKAPRPVAVESATVRVALAAPANSMAQSSSAEVNRQPTNDELHQIVTQFIGSYNQGDLEAFMSLLDENVRTDEPGGWVGIHQAYERLFNRSLSREMVLRNLQWQRSGEAVIGRPNYRVTISRPGDKASHLYTGVLKIEVAMLGGRPMITGFFNKADRK